MIERKYHFFAFSYLRIRLCDNSRNTLSSAAVKTLKDTYANDVVNEKTCRSLKDEPRAGCSKKLNPEQLEVAIDENPTCTTRELSKNFDELTESLNGTKGHFKRGGGNEASFFSESKLAKFYEEGMRKLMARWEDVINKNGDYVKH
ncbi:hypothetical protein ACTXT7_015626 [Hymenolepis weldensis]